MRQFGIRIHVHSIEVLLTMFVVIGTTVNRLDTV